MWKHSSRNGVLILCLLLLGINRKRGAHRNHVSEPSDVFLYDQIHSALLVNLRIMEAHLSECSSLTKALFEIVQYVIISEKRQLTVASEASELNTMCHGSNPIIALLEFSTVYPYTTTMLSRFKGYLRLSQSTIDSFHSTFSPLRLFSQIVILQLFYYFSALVTFSLVAWLSGYQFTLEWIFSWSLISSENILGWTLSITWLFNSLLCVLFMTFVIGRSKLAWDFALTLHTINFFVVWIYSHQIPTHILWWVLQILSCALLVGLGTWSTRWKELRDTFFEGMLDTEAQPVEMNDLPK